LIGIARKAARRRISRKNYKVAIASVRCPTKSYKQVFGGDRLTRLVGKGARIQGLLSATTRDCNDVKYVETLIGPDTVATAPLETLNTYRDHGDPKARLKQDVKEARCVLEQLPEPGMGERVYLKKALRRQPSLNLDGLQKKLDRKVRI
jgi:transaldolase